MSYVNSHFAHLPFFHAMRHSGMPLGKYPHIEIGERLSIIRDILDLSNNDLAESLGVSSSRIGNWISGHRRLPVDYSIKLLRVYGISLDYIYDGKVNALPASIASAVASRPSDNKAT